VFLGLAIGGGLGTLISWSGPPALKSICTGAGLALGLAVSLVLLGLDPIRDAATRSRERAARSRQSTLALTQAPAVAPEKNKKRG
jgi:hypothetical protein